MYWVILVLVVVGALVIAVVVRQMLRETTGTAHPPAGRRTKSLTQGEIDWMRCNHCQDVVEHHLIVGRNWTCTQCRRVNRREIVDT